MSDLPGSGMGMAGRGTLKGGTMTGGKPGIGEAACGTVWGNATGRGGGPVVMATVTVGGLTAVIGVAMAVGVVVTTDGISTTSGATVQTIGYRIITLDLLMISKQIIQQKPTNINETKCFSRMLENDKRL